MTRKSSPCLATTRSSRPPFRMQKSRRTTGATASRSPSGVTVHVEPAHHWSARGTRDRRMALWGGFVVETPAGNIFVAGDTGFHGGKNYRGMAAQTRLVPPRHTADRRLRAALVHGAAASEPGRGGRRHAAQQCRLCRRLPLGHVPSHQRADRRTARPASCGAGRKRHRAREFRAMLPGEVWDVPAALTAQWSEDKAPGTRWCSVSLP